MNTLDFGGRSIDLSTPKIMGILNVTPDSFSDGGRFFSDGLVIDRVVDEAARMVAAGATFLDIGGESTRPGAAPVGEQAELERVLPVFEALARRFDVVLSIDTSRASVMTAVAEAGAGLINDVRALRQPGALAAAAATGLPVCLMHMQGEPGHMQAAPSYEDVVAEVENFLAARVTACQRAGIPADRLILDPGFGFGKTLSHNVALFRTLPRFCSAVPVLIGVSRKTMVGEICAKPVAQRMVGSVALALLAAQAGAAILRVHDVDATADALKVLAAVNNAL